tara:strand:+ start:34 stop:1248 length:1215 start_codon:yes stop_codon:yes gene_type:complete
MNIKIFLSNTFLILFLFFILIFLLNTSYIYNFVWQTQYIFQDLTMPVKWLECHKAGIDIFKSDICAGGTFAYGPIFLKLPINETLKIFYLEYLPYLSIFFLVTFIVLSFKKNNVLSILLIFLCIFNPSTLLLLQRMNLDIVVFLFVIFLSFNKIYPLNWLVVFFLAFSKIYPVVSGTIVFFENKKRSLTKMLLIIFGMMLLSLLYLFNYFEDYINFFNGLSANKAGYHFLFSLNSIPKIFKYSYDLNYIFLLIVVYLLFFFLISKLTKKLSIIDFNLVNYYSYDFKIFLLGSLISLMSFILFSNYFHREIFLIMTIPFIFTLYNLTNIKIIKYFIIFIIIKYIYLFIYSFININDGLSYENNQRVFSNYFLIIIFIKSMFDFVQMTILASFTLITSKKFLKLVK